jgi:hypothetical protein
VEDWRDVGAAKAKSALERVYGVSVMAFGPSTWSAITPGGYLVTDSLPLLIAGLEAAMSPLPYQKD